MRPSRSEVLDPAEIQIAHVHNRTVRRCFLMGDDTVSGKNFDHRKVWIEDILQHFAAQFGIDLLNFSILSNHFHLILRTRPDVVANWDDQEVARRWLMICPPKRNQDGSPQRPTAKEIRSISGCPLRLAQIRLRLSDIAWWMRLLCQRVATRSNKEDGETGRFFQDRYRATLLVDEASILACALYVDLNPIRAAIAQTIETSDHTSAQRRIEAVVTDGQDQQPAVQRLSVADFLSPLPIDEQNDPVGPRESQSSARCSDKGYLAMSLSSYLELLDWAARQPVDGKTGWTPPSVPPVLRRLGLDGATFLELSRDFGKLFCSVAGSCECVDAMRTRRSGRRFYLRRRARELMTVDRAEA